MFEPGIDGIARVFGGAQENFGALGDELDGTVTGIMPNGTIFVSIDRYLVDGAIKSRDMKGGDGERQLTEDDKHFVPCPHDVGSVSRRILDCIEAMRNDDALPTSKT